ncbi:organic hydroperoxide resistance protein [Peribacillus deserti]|uniref:Organic hydroperoxide resistance protein OhrA n=1 Tax=Peribacillus deserti TaxID=673318 RepID=A0A2N5M6H5_9BACI|nr:organic hydroperoxide resistance protein [Peribacillus deserti]PLT29945.1 Organic hydroperoxide resistance protein OhrA [Peribacillus deserti]
MSVLFTAKATSRGGRAGTVRSDDGVIDFQLANPKALNGDGGNGTNPEALFAAGYAACFNSALSLVAGKEKVSVDPVVAAEVSLLKDESDNGFKLGVVLNVDFEGISQEQAESLVEKAHQVCPYSKATRGNIDVELKVNAN